MSKFCSFYCILKVSLSPIILMLLCKKYSYFYINISSESPHIAILLWAIEIWRRDFRIWGVVEFLVSDIVRGIVAGRVYTDKNPWIASTTPGNVFGRSMWNQLANFPILQYFSLRIYLIQRMRLAVRCKYFYWWPDNSFFSRWLKNWVCRLIVFLKIEINGFP